MRRLTSLIAAAGALAACAPAVQRDEGSPLAARLSPSAVGTTVGLSDDAYVAVFAITPGRGTALVYPAVGDQKHFSAGWRPLNPFAWSPERVGFARFRAFSFDTPSTVLILLAAREPLDVNRYVTSSYQLQRDLGDEAYLARDPDEVIERIAALFVGGRADDSWAMDISVLPNAGSFLAANTLGEPRLGYGMQYVTVRCPDGARTVQVEWSDLACVPQPPRPNPQAPDPDTTQHGEEGEGQGSPNAFRSPLVRREIPAAERGALRPVDVSRSRTVSDNGPRVHGAPTGAGRDDFSHVRPSEPGPRTAPAPRSTGGGARDAGGGSAPAAPREPAVREPRTGGVERVPVSGGERVPAEGSRTP